MRRPGPHGLIGAKTQLVCDPRAELTVAVLHDVINARAFHFFFNPPNSENKAWSVCFGLWSPISRSSAGDSIVFCPVLIDPHPRPLKVSIAFLECPNVSRLFNRARRVATRIFFLLSTLRIYKGISPSPERPLRVSQKIVNYNDT